MLRLASRAAFGQAQYEPERNQEALGYLETWLNRATRKFPEPLTLAAIVCRRLDKQDAARQHLRDALEADPLGTDANLHRYDDQMSDEDRAWVRATAADLATAWTADPKTPPAPLAMARLLAGDGPDAESAITRIFVESGAEADLTWYLHRARARFLAGRNEDALRDAERVRAVKEVAERAEKLIEQIRKATQDK